MSEERNILKAAAIALEDAHFKSEQQQDGYFRASVLKQIRDYLAQPEQPPLTPLQCLEEYKRGHAKADLDLKREPLLEVGNE